MDIASERSYPTPFANSAILPLLLLSLSSQRNAPKVTKNIDTEYDYIIVGGGTAGSVVANRMSELPCVNVLLLEAGKDPPLLTDIPALSKFFKFTDLDWNYKTVPQKHAGEALLNKKVPLASGKTLGGSSVLNSMAATRGSPLDYEEWASEGADGWSYEDVFPYFKSLEDNKDPEYIKNGYHNTGGPLTIQRPRYLSEIKKPLFQAARSLGYKVVDPNALKMTGFYDFQGTLRNGQRCSTSKAYLVPAENRTNLHILTKAMVRKVVIENGSASGVLYDYGGETLQVRARREVILSAGTFNTAHLLMLSGVGPKEHLEKLKIPVLADLPVGDNLQDHCAVPLHFVLNSSISSALMKIVNPANVDEYIKTKTGILSSADLTSALGFFNGAEQVGRKDLPSFQIRVFEDMTIIPKLQYGLKPEIYSQVFSKYQTRPYITCLSGTLRPRSRGTVRLQSTNPYDPPLIDPNFLENPNDVKDIVEGLKVCMKLARTQAMRRLGTAAFDTFYPACLNYKREEELYLWCLAKQVILSMNNAVGTVKMGSAEDPTTVVDSNLRLKQIKRLRVIDASVMPTITSGDTTIPTIMIAERASDILKSTIDCEDLMVESDVQASVPMISISSDILESLPKFLKPQVQRRNDNNAVLDQLKEVFGLYNRDKEAYHKSVADSLQTRIRDLSYALQDSPPPPRRHSIASPQTSVSDLIQCLEEIKQQLQNQGRYPQHNAYQTKNAGSDVLVNQILSALNSAAPNRYPTHTRNVASHNEIPPVVINQMISLVELLREDRDVSETTSSSSVAAINQPGALDAINQLLSVLNNPVRNEMQSQAMNLGSGMSNNNQNPLLNQVLSTLQNPVQTVQTTTQNPITPSPNTTQNVIQEQLDNILASINEMRQGSAVAQNETIPTNNTTDKTQEMMSQILSAITEMRNSSQPNSNQTSNSNTPSSNSNSEDSALNQILKTLNEIRQNNETSRQSQAHITTPSPLGNNSSDLLLSQLVSSINEMKEEIRAVRNLNLPNVNDPIQRQGTTTLQDLLNNQQLPVQGINNPQVTGQATSAGPLIETIVLQQPPNSPQQMNGMLPPAIQPGMMNAMPVAPPPVNPVANLMQGQRTFQLIASLLGRNTGMNQSPPPPHPYMGMPPGNVPHRMPYPPPFVPPGMPPNPCHRTVVMNNIHLCNGSNNPHRPLTPREVELCQSLHSGTQCQNQSNCRAVPPYLYNYYCSGK